MRVLNDLAAIAQVDDAELRQLVEQRVTELAPYIEGQLNELVTFLVVQPGDVLGTIEQHLGFHPLCNRFDGTCFGSPGFSPSFELIEEHPSWYEVVFILSDDGAGIELFVPKRPDVDDELQAMCARYALPRKGDPAA